MCQGQQVSGVLLVVSEREDDVKALHIPTEPLKSSCLQPVVGCEPGTISKVLFFRKKMFYIRKPILFVVIWCQTSG